MTDIPPVLVSPLDLLLVYWHGLQMWITQNKPQDKVRGLSCFYQWLEFRKHIIPKAELSAREHTVKVLSILLTLNRFSYLFPWETPVENIIFQLLFWPGGSSVLVKFTKPSLFIWQLNKLKYPVYLYISWLVPVTSCACKNDFYWCNWIFLESWNICLYADWTRCSDFILVSGAKCLLSVRKCRSDVNL